MDRPIIFSAPMVRALLDGRKSQTRRVLKEQPVWGTVELRLPYAPGDRLYVREAWRIRHILDPFPGAAIPEDEHRPIWYEADREGADYGKRIDFGRYRQGRFMPRWASRITLTVTEVRVQRLQEIDEADARAEGAPALGAELCPPDCEDIRSHVWGFHDLWNSLHGPDAWDANPWVVAVTFTTERRNIADI